MKVLVVDDDAVARKVLSAFLKQSNYEIQLAEDGGTAFRAMTAADAPSIAIVDWTLPDIHGPELCARLRAHDFPVRPFLIMLTARKDKADIAVALDAGADDFISKPFNMQEMQARLRVASRSVGRQIELRERIATLEAELKKLRSAPPPAPAGQPATPTPAPAQPLTLPTDQIDTVIAGALRHGGLREAPRRLARGPATPRTAAWASLLVTNRDTWIDLALETDQANLAALFSQARRRPPIRAGELGAFGTALHTSIRDSIASVLRAMGGVVLQPFAPIAASESEGLGARLAGNSVERYHYNVGVATLTLAIAMHPSPLREKAAGQLNVGDVLAKPYPPTASHQVALLRAGVVLNEHYVEKIQAFEAESVGEAPPVATHAPSGFAQRFARRHESTRLADALA